MSKQYIITAYDMLFFGDGRPFSMTESETWTNGIFPPMPSTVYGFLRALYFENNISSLKEANRKNDPTGKLKITHFSLINENDKLLYPIPACFLKNDKNLIKLELRKQKLLTSSNYNYKLFARADGKLETLGKKYYLTKQQLELFLENKIPTEFVNIDNYITSEDRLGITKNYRTGKPEHGRLYRMQLNNTSSINNSLQEFKSISFIVEIDGLDDLPTQIGKLGGEAKAANLTKIKFDKVITPKIKDDIAVIYFATPGIFKENYYPESLFKDYNIDLLFISNEKPLYVSGWDMIKREPKTSKRVLPAGSLIFIKFNDKALKEHFIEMYQGKQLGFSKEKDNYTQQGFNQIYIGNYSLTE